MCNNRVKIRRYQINIEMSSIQKQGTIQLEYLRTEHVE